MMDYSTEQQCKSLLDACKVCDDADLSLWNEWSSCDVKCGLGHRRRERDIYSVANCKASLLLHYLQVKNKKLRFSIYYIFILKRGRFNRFTDP